MGRNTVQFLGIGLMTLVLTQVSAGAPPSDCGPVQPDPGIRVVSVEEEGLRDAPLVPAIPAGPRALDRPLESQPEPDFVVIPEPQPLRYPFDPPSGFTGKSSVAPSEVQGDSDFVPREDRWRIGFPAWDRYGKDHPLIVDYPYDLGHWFDPYQQNVLKGDFPIIGQHTFLNITAASVTRIDGRQVPTATTPFESTARSREEDFFGSPNQAFNNQFFKLRFDLFHGDAAFKPRDWRVVVMPVFNINLLSVDELAVVNPDIRDGVQRSRGFIALEEAFLEAKLADTSPYYDFVSARVGSQFFVSDFRGFIFEDINRAVRLFGTSLSNRAQFNLAYFRQAEKDTNSQLNSFNDRKQDIVIGNFFFEDFIFPGYTILTNFHYNHDPASFKFDKNNFLVRPDPTGVFQPHSLDVFYLGCGGDGHIGRYNLTHMCYWAFGHDTRNPIANQPVDISAYFAAVELSYDRDWARFRTSFLYSSGDRNPNNSHATGFDTILDNPNFAGGFFSFWQRQAIRLFGVNLVNDLSLTPNLRSSRVQGQSNFVNPGLILINAGFDMDLTPRLKMVNNINWLWFDSSEVLEQYVFSGRVDNRIGTDLSTGFEYRPLLSENIVMIFGVSALVPGGGFKSLYNKKDANVDPLVSAFLQLDLVF